MEMLKERLHGVFAFPVTPFKAGNLLELDEQGLADNVRFLVSNGVRRIVPCAGTGELLALTEDEHRRAITIVVEAAGQDTLVVPGIPGATKPAIEAARFIESLNIEVVLAFPPSGPETGVKHHYELLSQGVRLALILYNTAGWTPQFIARLAKIPRVAAVKDELSELRTFSRAARLVGEQVVMIGGVDHGAGVAPQYFMAGMKGYTCGLVNFAPTYELQLYEAAIRRDYAKVTDLQQTLGPLSDFRSRVGKVSVVKAAMDMVGLTGGPPRPPNIPLNDDERRELRRLLSELGLQV